MAFIIDGTTGIATVDGSVSAPSQRGQDSNTGISYAADTIKFSTNGVERMSITNSGVTGVGKFASYAILVDQKTSGTNGGSFTSGDWRTRDLNTETTDEDGIVSLSSNQFTLGAGSYLIQYFAPACQANSHQARLYNITDSSEASLGSTEYAGTGSNMPQTTSYGYIRLTLTGNKVFELQHRCSSTINNYGMGVGSAGGFNWGTTKFATVVIYKEA